MDLSATIFSKAGVCVLLFREKTADNIWRDILNYTGNLITPCQIVYFVHFFSLRMKRKND